MATKTLEAPKKIYIDISLDSAWGMTTRSYDNEIEYTRTDAFIKKACEFLKDRIEHDSIDYPMATKHLVEDFKKYMED